MAAKKTKGAGTRIAALDHISAPVRDIEAARTFYGAALGAIGMKINMDLSSAFGMGSGTQKIFWLTRHARAAGGGHYAFRVDHRTEVEAFHAAALDAGGKDNGKPGPRPDYGSSYYAAFIKDGEDNNIEVVCYARAAPKRPAAKAKTNAKTKTMTEQKKAAPKRR